MTAISTYQPGSGRVGASSPVGFQASAVGYLSIDAAAVYASVSTKTIKRWIQAGLPVYQGTRRGKVLIRPSDIDLYLQKKTAPKVDLDAMVNDVLQDLVALERTTTARTASQKLEN